jgi:hypothetical protein
VGDGFAGAFRRSELKITIHHSKTDQEGAGQTIAVPFGKIACPVEQTGARWQDRG